jgi:hypothetical protein
MCFSQRAVPILLLLLEACAHNPPPKPTPFSKSEAFHKSSSTIYGILERDLDEDGLSEVVVANKTDHGFALSTYRQHPAASGNTWERICDGEVAVGSELEVLSFIEVEDGALALIAAKDDNPDEELQSFVLIDPAAGCATRFKDQLRLPKPADAVITPGAVPAGVIIVEHEPGFRLVDEPRVLHLTAAEGKVDLLTGVRTRLVTGKRREVAVDEAALSFLRPIPIAVHWQASEADPIELFELVDDDATTEFVAKPGVTGTLKIAADAPFVALELVHGCYGGSAAALELASEQGTRFVTGEAAAADSFVAANGKSFGDEAGGRHELLALRSAATSLTLSVGPVAAERCLRDVRAFGFRP